MASSAQTPVRIFSNPFLQSWATGLALTFLLMLFASAQDQGEGAKPAQPSIKFQVLEQKRIHLGNRSLFLNRVVPPVLPPAPPPPPAPELTAAELEMVQRREGKESKMLFLSATVYDRQVTDLRWWENGQRYRVFSNIDFNHIAGMGEFETDSAVYWLLMGIGNESSQEIAEWNRQVEKEGWPPEMKKVMQIKVPSARAFPAGRSSYFMAPEDDFVAAWNRYVTEQGLPAEEMLAPESPPIAPTTGSRTKAETDSDPYAALDALHVFYDANRSRLAQEYEKREAARIAHEKWQKEHPPVPKDTVINYWLGERSAGTGVLDKRSMRIQP